MSDANFLAQIENHIHQNMTFENLTSGEVDFTDEIDNMTADFENKAFECEIEVSDALNILAKELDDKIQVDGQTDYILLLKDLVQIVTERLSGY